MKGFITRNIINLIIVSIVLTFILLPNFLQDTTDIIFVIAVVFLYAFLFILLYGGISSIIAEILSLRAVRKKRLIIKTMVYLAALIIFSFFSPPPLYIFYAFIMAILYFILDEYIRNKQTRAS